jgi:hypothetical protein
MAMWLIAATRAYFSMLLWGAIAVTYAGCAIAGIPSRRRCVVHAALVLPVLALIIGLGAEGNYPRFVRAVAASIPQAVMERRWPMAKGGLEELDRRREAIGEYGGNSMLSRPAGSEGRIGGLAVGLGAVVLPISLLGRAAGLDLHIGTSARLIADADTVAFDVLALLILSLMIANRRQISPPPLVFGLALALLVALPLAYVMTNYGTLIRLRLMVAAPMWLLTLALAPGLAARASPSGAAPSRSPADMPAPSAAR